MRNMCVYFSAILSAIAEALVVFSGVPAGLNSAFSCDVTSVRTYSTILCSYHLASGPFIATQLNSTSSWVELGCELCRYKRALMCLVVAYFKSTLNDVKAPDPPLPPTYILTNNSVTQLFSSRLRLIMIRWKSQTKSYCTCFTFRSVHLQPSIYHACTFTTSW